MQTFSQDVDVQDGPSDDSLQRRALLAYLSLTERAGSWAGRLVLLAASDEAAPFALGALAAGGAVLWTCPDQPTLRASGRAGIVDFEVTTLSEALRILKNEIRKGLPVSVGVLDAERTIWDEAVRRGVQPQALLAGARDAVAAEMLSGRGADWLQTRAVAQIEEHRAETWRERRSEDEFLLAEIERLAGPEQAVARRWMRAAPRLFPRETSRWYAAVWTASKAER